MGDKRVGKTSIVQAYIEEELQRGMKYKPTPVMQDASKLVQVEDKDTGLKTKLQLNFLDAAGESNIHNLAHLFARDI